MGRQKQNKDYSDPETLSVSAKEDVRKRLEEDIEAFLADGGAITSVAPNVLADPPSKPTNKYGS